MHNVAFAHSLYPVLLFVNPCATLKACLVIWFGFDLIYSATLNGWFLGSASTWSFVVEKFSNFYK